MLQLHLYHVQECIITAALCMKFRNACPLTQGEFIYCTELKQPYPAVWMKVAKVGVFFSKSAEQMKDFLFLFWLFVGQINLDKSFWNHWRCRDLQPDWKYALLCCCCRGSVYCVRQLLDFPHNLNLGFCSSWVIQDVWQQRRTPWSFRGLMHWTSKKTNIPVPCFGFSLWIEVSQKIKSHIRTSEDVNSFTQPDLWISSAAPTFDLQTNPHRCRQ